jgi:aromatic ring hydroxylase
MIELLMRRNGGTMGRLPEYMASIMVGLYDIRNLLGEEDPAFARNVESYFEYVRENDLALTHSFADAPRDTRLARGEFENLRVVEERPDGIVVRGVKSVATLAPYADEYLALAPNRPGLAPDEIVYFAVPVDTRGLRVYCRPSASGPATKDFPLSARFDEMDAWVVFDDVLVPSDRVFYLHRREGHRDLLGRMLAWAFYHILIRMAVKAEVLAGIATAITDYLGKQEALATQLSLVDLYSYAETLRAFVRAAEDDPVPSVSGFVVPNPTQITLGRIHAVDRQPQMLQLVRELSGSGLLMAPGHDDFDNPAIRADVERYLIGPDSMAADRFQLLKLAREYTSESFGARQLLFEMHNAGAQLTTKQRLAASYDASAHVRLAKQLAGIEPTGLGDGSQP